MPDVHISLDRGPFEKDLGQRGALELIRLRTTALTHIIFTICLHIGKYVKCFCICRGQYFLRFHSSTYVLEIRNSLCQWAYLLYRLKTTQMDWSPFVSSLWRACSNPCQKYVGKNYTTIYFMIYPTVNLKVANFIEQMWRVHHSTHFWGIFKLKFCSSWMFRDSPAAVCVYQDRMVHAHWSRTNIWKLLSLFLSLSHTFTVPETAATAGNVTLNGFHIFCTFIWYLFKPEYTWFWYMGIFVLKT